MGKKPKNAESILGQDVNANIGVRGEDDEDVSNVIGPHGFNNRNEKGVWALQWLNLMQLKAANTFFEHQDYTTHTSFLPPSLPQMLDIWSVSSSSFKRVRNCGVCTCIPSDHVAVGLQLSISSIKDNREFKLAKVQIDWNKIRNDASSKQRFNERLSELNLTSKFPYSPLFTNVILHVQ